MQLGTPFGKVFGLKSYLKFSAAVSALSAYAVGSFEPDLVFDFEQEYYRTSGTQTTFDSAITHSRSGNATMVDSDGLLKWAPHNLVTYSEDFSNALWDSGASTGTITTGQADSDGGTNACLLSDPVGGGNGNRVRQAVTTIGGVEYTYEVIAKAGTSNWIMVFSGDAAGSHFDLGSGSLGAVVGSPDSRTITSLGDGFYLIQIKDVATTTSGYLSIEVTNADASSVADSGDNCVIYAARTYRSDLGGMVNNPDRGDSYVPTTSAARYLARRGHHVYNGAEWVNEGLLHESEARTNLVTYSEGSGAATAPPGYSWLGSGSGETATTLSNGLEGYALSGGDRYLRDAIGLTATTYTASVFIEPNATYSGKVIELSGFVGATGTLSATVSDADESGRVSITFTVDAGDIGGDIRIGQIDASSGTLSFGGWQLELGSTPSSYIPTAGSTVTRAADTLTVPSANLPWPTPNVIGEELVTNGTFDENAVGWSNPANVDVEAISGELRLSNQSASPVSSQQSISLTVGKVYAVTVTSRMSGTGGNVARASFFGNIFASSSGAAVTETIYVTATVSSASLGLFSFGTSGTIAYFDNISVREIDPLAVSIQMEGRMTYADENTVANVAPYLWQLDINNRIRPYISTVSGTGTQFFTQTAAGVLDAAASNGSYYSPGINVPFNIASRHGSTFINGAVDGTALTADTTPTALPDLSTTDLSLAYSGGPMILRRVRIWADDLGDAGIATASVTHPAIFGKPTITGVTSVGSELTATSAPIVIGTPTPTRTWQWLRNGSPIVGATSNIYTIVEADIGSTLSVRQTETNIGGFASVTSDPTDTVIAVPASAIRDRLGDPILDRSGDFILVRI